MTLFIDLGWLYCKQTQRAFNVFKNTLNWLKIDSVDQKLNWLECGNFSQDAGTPGTERVIAFSQLAVKGLRYVTKWCMVQLLMKTQNLVSLPPMACCFILSIYKKVTVGIILTVLQSNLSSGRPETRNQWLFRTDCFNRECVAEAQKQTSRIRQRIIKGRWPLGQIWLYCLFCWWSGAWALRGGGVCVDCN
jgi:hypothetical protein